MRFWAFVGPEIPGLRSVLKCGVDLYHGFRLECTCVYCQTRFNYYFVCVTCHTDVEQYFLHLAPCMGQNIEHGLRRLLQPFLNGVVCCLNSNSSHFFCSPGDIMFGQYAVHQKRCLAFSITVPEFQQCWIVRQVLCPLATSLVYYEIQVVECTSHTSRLGTCRASVVDDRFRWVSYHWIALINICTACTFISKAEDCFCTSYTVVSEETFSKPAGQLGYYMFERHAEYNPKFTTMNATSQGSLPSSFSSRTAALQPLTDWSSDVLPMIIHCP